MTDEFFEQIGIPNNPAAESLEKRDAAVFCYLRDEAFAQATQKEIAQWGHVHIPGIADPARYLMDKIRAALVPILKPEVGEDLDDELDLRKRAIYGAIVQCGNEYLLPDCIDVDVIYDSLDLERYIQLAVMGYFEQGMQHVLASVEERGMRDEEEFFSWFSGYLTKALMLMPRERFGYTEEQWNEYVERTMHHYYVEAYLASWQFTENSLQKHRKQLTAKYDDLEFTVNELCNSDGYEHFLVKMLSIWETLEAVSFVSDSDFERLRAYFQQFILEVVTYSYQQMSDLYIIRTQDGFLYDPYTFVRDRCSILEEIITRFHITFDLDYDAIVSDIISRTDLHLLVTAIDLYIEQNEARSDIDPYDRHYDLMHFIQFLKSSAFIENPDIVLKLERLEEIRRRQAAAKRMSSGGFYTKSIEYSDEDADTRKDELNVLFEQFQSAVLQMGTQYDITQITEYLYKISPLIADFAMNPDITGDGRDPKYQKYFALNELYKKRVVAIVNQINAFVPGRYGYEFLHGHLILPRTFLDWYQREMNNLLLGFHVIDDPFPLDNEMLLTLERIPQERGFLEESLFAACDLVRKGLEKSGPFRTLDHTAIGDSYEFILALERTHTAGEYREIIQEFKTLYQQYRELWAPKSESGYMIRIYNSMDTGPLPVVSAVRINTPTPTDIRRATVGIYPYPSALPSVYDAAE